MSKPGWTLVVRDGGKAVRVARHFRGQLAALLWLMKEADQLRRSYRDPVTVEWLEGNLEEQYLADLKVG
jgi:hypothetical protein